MIAHRNDIGIIELEWDEGERQVLVDREVMESMTDEINQYRALVAAVRVAVRGGFNEHPA